jgi:hypothetical protein
MKSEVEQTFEKLQDKLGGNIPWGQLDSVVQLQFVQVVNFILKVCEAKI